MPDQNNKIIKNDLEVVLKKAELSIATFEPPTAGLFTSVDSLTNNQNPPTISKIQEEIANQSATERTNALFDFLTGYIIQGTKEEIDRQQILQIISQLKDRVNTIEEILQRNNIV